MDFFSWHYSLGLNLYFKFYATLVLAVIDYFSLGLLLPTLFSPYKKIIMPEYKHNMSLGERLNIISFNFVSRFIGAIVRLVLLFVGIISLVLIVLSGFLGLIFWVVLPFFSVPLFIKYLSNPQKFTRDTISKANRYPQDSINILLSNRAGKFMAEKLGISLEILLQGCDKKEIKIEKEILNYQDLISFLVENEVWSQSFYTQNKLDKRDLVLSAKWWNDTEEKRTLINTDKINIANGIGRELTFGFTPNLDKYGKDLSLEIKGFSHHLIGRKNIVDRIERTFAAQSSVILKGLPGVGKRTVALEFTKRTNRRVVEVDLNFLTGETVDINQKKSNLSQILSEAAYAGNIVMLIRDMHRFTNLSVEGLDFTDIFEEVLQKGSLKLIAISTNEDYERFLETNGRIRKYFDAIDVVEPTRDEAMEIAIEAAKDWQTKAGLTITVPTLRKIVDSSDKFVTDTPFPEKALEILTAVVTYHLQKGQGKVLTIEEAETVMSERTGISFASLTQEKSEMLSNLEEILNQKLIGQTDATTLISKVLRSKSSGVVDTKRPIGSFLFLGPTGVGKTETAKVLAKVYFGSADAITRFDMAEYLGENSFDRFLDALTSSIKKHPASLLLLDEIEKAPHEVFNLLLALLDEGMITDRNGARINCSNLFVIATSNAGAEHIRELVSKGNTENIHKDVTEFVMRAGNFSPELVNRFDSVVVYQPLKEESLNKISRIMLQAIVENMKLKNINVEISEEAIRKLAKDGYEPEFGARPMRRLIDLEIGDLLGKAILENRLSSSDNIKLVVNQTTNSFDFENIR